MVGYFYGCRNLFRGYKYFQKLVNTIFDNGGVIESVKDGLPSLETIFITLTSKKQRD